ncbi:ABC transporter ATP-binding protein [Flavihumibacter profundi]|uniref:ABC transporter ATP-binding protein n=1 Tax=Flavihumibacter profundi TaxID=2716883 RepID=UPI001CC46EB1|nr:ATP-binding cassette domain-containing protein [Flavihumibacter profundi]MBZ5858153.1 ATP-binding cassette domain-containing protein [Flavihumibacter profundi]
MTIALSETGKRFNREWIFRQLSYTFHAGKAYAITGPNGSGKSTLLQAIAGSLTISAGKIKYTLQGKEVDPDAVFRHLSIAAPYLELIEEMTAVEFLTFHEKFKPLLPGFTIFEILAKVGLDAAAHKQVRYYSSGMKQRLKLAQAIFSDTQVVMLDEPCTNLDATGINLYQQLIADFGPKRLIIVSSNDPQEYNFCTEAIHILDYKSQAGKNSITNPNA